MFQQGNNFNFDPETTTCCFAHPKIDGMYFCDDSPQGFTQNINHATKYMGKKARERGMKKVKERYSQIKDGMLIFCYINN